MTPKQKNETKLFMELQRKHGYAMLAKPIKSGMWFDPKTRKLEPTRIVQLAVPANSALGQLLKVK